MSSYSIIQKSQLEGVNRLDAEYYKPEYLQIKQVLFRELSSIPLTEIISRPVVTGSTPKLRDCKGDGTDIKFVKTDTLRDGEIVFDSADCLPLKQSRENSEPQKGDILVTIIGATHEIVGRSSLVFDSDPKMNINQNIALIRPSKLIEPAFLEAFLRGKFGRMQLWQQSRQTEQVNLNCREVEQVIVPLPSEKFQESIKKFVEESRTQKFLSLQYSQEAENLLLEELGLKDFQENDDLSWIENFSEIEKAGRMDADYFQPKYEHLITKLKGKKSRPLLEVVNSVAAKFNPQTEPYQTFRYVELSNINSSNGIIDGFSEVLGKEAPSRAKRILRTDDVIVSSVEGSLGSVALVNMEQEDYLASTGFFQLRSKEILPEVLLVLSKSIVLKMQLEKQCAGTILAAVPQDALKNIIIPVLPLEMQKKIADLVRQSHEARKKSKELLEEAKRKVEEMIEKGGAASDKNFLR